MKQFKATQITPQYGPQSLFLRFIGKFIFMKGVQGSSDYVQKLIDDFEKRGASIIKGNGGWMRIDIVKNNKIVILGDVTLDMEEMDDAQIEEGLYSFFAKKYTEAKFVVQEVLE